MERLTNRVGKYIEIKGCKSLYPNEERKTAPASNVVVRLAAYEDTGLTPEEIKALILPPNDPLTLEELLKMDGEAVWTKDGECYIVNVRERYATDKYRGFKMITTLFEKGVYRRKPEEGTA